jgi:hypothetical protein
LLGGRLIARVGRAHVHPGHEIGDDVVVEFRAVFRHLEIGVFVPDRLDEETFGRVSGNDGGAGIAALFDRAAPVQLQAALGLFPGVAFVAFRNEHGADLALEKLRLFGSGRAGRDRAHAQRESDGHWQGAKVRGEARSHSSTRSKSPQDTIFGGLLTGVFTKLS